jgi:hypothetical protein
MDPRAGGLEPRRQPLRLDDRQLLDGPDSCRFQESRALRADPAQGREPRSLDPCARSARVDPKPPGKIGGVGPRELPRVVDSHPIE